MALLAIITLAVIPEFGVSQVTPPSPGGQRQRLELEQRLQRGFNRTVQTQLGLDQSQMEKVQGVMMSFQTERRNLNRAQASLRYKLRDPGLFEIEDEEARALLQDMVRLQEQELDLYKREQAELLQFLPPAKLVSFYRLREDLGQRVQQLRQGRGQGAGRGPGGGGVGIPNGNQRPGGWVPR
jgi:hypothetical protein